jgi:hypothetical protein
MSALLDAGEEIAACFANVATMMGGLSGYARLPLLIAARTVVG